MKFRSLRCGAGRYCPFPKYVGAHRESRSSFFRNEFSSFQRDLSLTCTLYSPFHSTRYVAHGPLQGK
jgi:hypothetical protein